MINIISWISVIGVGVGTLALIIILSAFNGLENLVENLYASFDPDLKIELKEGKTFDAATFSKKKILAIPEVAFYTESLEEVALVKFEDKQTFATVKGVEASFYSMSGLDTMLINGDRNTFIEAPNYMVLGYGIADKLSLYLSGSVTSRVSIIVPKKGHKKGLTPNSEFNRKFTRPSGIFSVNPDFNCAVCLISILYETNP